MFTFRVIVTTIDLFLMAIITTSVDLESKNAMIGSFFIDIALLLSVFLIWR